MRYSIVVGVFNVTQPSPALFIENLGIWKTLDMVRHGLPPCTVEDKEQVLVRFGGELGVENALKVYLDDNVKKFCFRNTTSHNEEYQNFKNSRQAVFAVSNNLIVGSIFGTYETDANSSEDETSGDETLADETSEDETSEDETSEDETSEDEFVGPKSPAVRFGIHSISNEESEVDLEAASEEEDSEEEDFSGVDLDEDSEEEETSEEDFEMDTKINVAKHWFVDETDDSGDESIDVMFGPLGEVTDSMHGHWIIGSHCVSQMFREYGLGRYLMIRLLQKMLVDRNKPVVLEVNKLGDEGDRHDTLVSFYQKLNFHVIASDGTWADGVRVWKSEEFRHRSTYMLLPVVPVFTVK